MQCGYFPILYWFKSGFFFFFWSKSSEFCIVRTIRLCSNISSMWSKLCMERLWTSNVSISNGNIKYPIGKSIFAVNLPLKLFRATVANTDIGSLKSVHIFFKKCLYHMLVKFEQHRLVLTTRNFELKKKNKTKQNKTKQNKKRGF